MFARDSASPPSPIDMSRASIDTEDVPIQERIYAHEMTQEYEGLLAADAGTDWSFERENYEYLQPDVPTAALWTTLPQGDWGQNAPDWISFLDTFKSAPCYIKELNRYLVYHEMQPIVTEESLLPNVKSYFNDNFDETKTDAKNRRAPPTMRSAFSVLKKFWRYSARGDLKQLAPLVGDKLNTWDKEWTTTKAPTFTKGDLGKCIFHIVQPFRGLPNRLTTVWVVTQTVVITPIHMLYTFTKGDLGKCIFRVSLNSLHV
jgi:hypothetical protein